MKKDTKQIIGMVAFSSLMGGVSLFCLFSGFYIPCLLALACVYVRVALLD